MCWQAQAAATLSNGNTQMMKRSSLCGKRENRDTNASEGKSNLRILTSIYAPKGISITESPSPLGIAEQKYQSKGEV